MSTDKIGNIVDNLFDNQLLVPRRMGQKMLQSLIIGVWNGFSHPLHIFLIGLDQALEILLGGRVDIFRK